MHLDVGLPSMPTYTYDPHQPRRNSLLRIYQDFSSAMIEEQIRFQPPPACDHLIVEILSVGIRTGPFG